MILTGDFNKLRGSVLQSHYGFDQLVKMAKLGSPALDTIWSNMAHVFFVVTLSVFKLSANFGVTLWGPILLHYLAILLYYQLVVTLSVNWSYIMG